MQNERSCCSYYGKFDKFLALSKIWLPYEQISYSQTLSQWASAMGIECENLCQHSPTPEFNPSSSWNGLYFYRVDSIVGVLLLIYFGVTCRATESDLLHCWGDLVTVFQRRWAIEISQCYNIEFSLITVSIIMEVSFGMEILVTDA